MQTNLLKMGARSFASVKVAFRLSPNQRTNFGHFFIDENSKSYKLNLNKDVLK